MPKAHKSAEDSHPDIEHLSTRERILNVAADQFAKYGFHGVSLRGILNLSGANIASGHYYFKSKKNVYIAALERSAEIVAKERTILLDRFEREDDWSLDRLPQLIAAYLGPHIRHALSAEGHSYGLIMARIGTEPEDVLQMVHAKLLTPNRMRFVTMLRRIFPKADERAFARAVSVTIAIMGGVPANYSHHLPPIPAPDPSEFGIIERMIIDAAAAGFLAVVQTKLS